MFQFRYLLTIELQLQLQLCYTNIQILLSFITNIHRNSHVWNP